MRNRRGNRDVGARRSFSLVWQRSAHQWDYRPERNRVCLTISCYWPPSLDISTAFEQINTRDIMAVSISINSWIFSYSSHFYVINTLSINLYQWLPLSHISELFTHVTSAILLFTSFPFSYIEFLFIARSLSEVPTVSAYGFGNSYWRIIEPRKFCL